VDVVLHSIFRGPDRSDFLLASSLDSCQYWGTARRWRADSLTWKAVGAGCWIFETLITWASDRAVAAQTGCARWRLAVFVVLMLVDSHPDIVSGRRGRDEACGFPGLRIETWGTQILWVVKTCGMRFVVSHPFAEERERMGHPDFAGGEGGLEKIVLVKQTKEQGEAK